MTDKQMKQLEVLLGEMNSKLHHIAFMKIKVNPHAEVVVGPATGTIPDGVKSFNIVNLGSGGDLADIQDLPITGIVGLTVIPKNIQTFAYSIENDENILAGPITITPVASHHVLIQYIKTAE
jgi:hypothetical protein